MARYTGGVAQGNEHGPRLTGDEYDRAVVDLQRGAPPIPSREEDEALRRRALNLAIDYRLGRKFPKDRREALWIASQRVEARRVRLGFMYLLRSLTGTRGHAQALTDMLKREYRKVLSASELEQFLGPAPHELPRQGEERQS